MNNDLIEVSGAGDDSFNGLYRLDGIDTEFFTYIKDDFPMCKIFFNHPTQVPWYSECPEGWIFLNEDSGVQENHYFSEERNGQEPPLAHWQCGGQSPDTIEPAPILETSPSDIPTYPSRNYSLVPAHPGENAAVPRATFFSATRYNIDIVEGVELILCSGVNGEGDTFVDDSLNITFTDVSNKENTETITISYFKTDKVGIFPLPPSDAFLMQKFPILQQFYGKTVNIEFELKDVYGGQISSSDLRLFISGNEPNKVTKS